MEISHEDFLMFIDRALDGMLRIVEELGEERANMRPDLPGANSPYAILTHCIGVCDYWIGTLLGKREVFRDRDAEFRAVAEGEEYEIAMSVVRHLGEMEEGQLGLAQAHVAAKVIQGLIGDH